MDGAQLAGGVALRLTAHVREERFPRPSPDGRWFAFTAQYEGKDDVYVMPWPPMSDGKIVCQPKMNWWACGPASGRNELIPVQLPVTACRCASAAWIR